LSGEAKAAIWAQAEDRLRSLSSANRQRSDEVLEPGDADGAHSTISGKRYLNFCSNDYLNLAHHPDVKKAAIEAVNAYGCGTTASRLVCGTLPVHHELEQALADFKSNESCLVYSSGYMACLGVLQALSLRADNSRVPIVFDRLSHASLVDGATHERRNWKSFPHNNTASLEQILESLPTVGWPSAILVTEGVFSMDGDMAPLKTMSDLCAKYKAVLVIDDAHGTGIMGPEGKGSAAAAGISEEPHVVQIGTLSKALGSQGGFVVGPKVLRNLMVNVSRTFIFDTGLNPAAAAAALAALNVLKAEPQRLELFKSNVTLFRTQLSRTGCDLENLTPIIPVMLRDEDRALAASAELRKKGFLVAAIRPPTVPLGTSRLRVTISAAHKEDDIRMLAKAISTVETI